MAKRIRRLRRTTQQKLAMEIADRVRAAVDEALKDFEEDTDTYGYGITVIFSDSTGMGALYSCPDDEESVKASMRDIEEFYRHWAKPGLKKK